MFSIIVTVATGQAQGVLIYHGSVRVMNLPKHFFASIFNINIFSWYIPEQK